MGFSGKGCQSLHIHVMRIRNILISYVKLDHTLYSINYGMLYSQVFPVRYQMNAPGLSPV